MSSVTREQVRTTRLWHPFALMGSVQGQQLVLERGEGVWVWDSAGQRYLDTTASLWYANVGHGRREIADAVQQQLGRLETFHIFDDLANEPALALAERLAELAPLEDPQVIFGSGGGDAVEAAVKLARRYWAEQGAPDRTHIISRTGGYHGMHGYGTGIVGVQSFKAGVGPLMPDSSTVAFDSIDAMRDRFDEIGADRVAAVIAEPVIGAGGVRAAPPGYFEELSALCDATGTLLIADEVINAFGRLGHWFGHVRFGMRPDMVVFAKGVTSGYLPLGGLIVSERIWRPFYDRPDAPMFIHGVTFAGHAACCAAAHANLDILERENLIPRGAELEGKLADALTDATDGSSAIGEVRAGVGLMGAIDVAPQVLERHPDAPTQIVRAARREGLLIRPLTESIVCSPPLIITAQELDYFAERLGRALLAVEPALTS